METDILSIISLCISIIVIPIGYLLGCRSARHAVYNSKIDELNLVTQQILEIFLKFYNKDYKDGNRNYYLMVAHQKRLQRYCEELERLGKIKQRPNLNNLLIEIKMIITDKVFNDDQKIRERCLSELIIKLEELNYYFLKKFI